MQRVVRINIAAPIIAFALTLSACGSDADETPDITEAIPLDSDSDAASDPDNKRSEGELSADHASQNGGNGEGTNSGSPNDQQERSIPDTMETGSNPPGANTPPAGSKVQRFN
ncbi:hypothetical protein [Erythrobacter sp.]|uniref:hypothetical protein n=1 Tax=Sphingomonadales TaxID=204457 RepID=UPI003266EAEB